MCMRVLLCLLQKFCLLLSAADSAPCVFCHELACDCVFVCLYVCMYVWINWYSSCLEIGCKRVSNSSKIATNKPNVCICIQIVHLLRVSSVFFFFTRSVFFAGFISFPLHRPYFGNVFASILHSNEQKMWCTKISITAIFRNDIRLRSISNFVRGYCGFLHWDHSSR